MGVVRQYVAGLAASMGAFALGSAIGWSGPMEPKVEKEGAYNFKTTYDDWGWISSMLNFGAACMCIPVGILIAKFGRKPIMLAMCLPLFIGWICIAIAQHVGMLYLGRFLVGASGGAFCVMAPVYTTEIADLSIRGVLGCFFQLLLVFGILCTFIVGAYANALVLNIVCTLVPIIFVVVFIWMPESPIYLAQNGKTERAEKALKWLHGGNDDIKDASVALPTSANRETGTIHLLTRKVALKGLGIAVTLMLLQQVTGINAILFYVTLIFNEAKTDLKPEMCTIIVGVVQVVATIIAMMLVERLGRKMLLLISAIVMGATTMVMGAYFAWLKHRDIGWLPVISISLFIIGFSLGFGPVPWLIMAELFAENVKPVCGAIVGTSSWLFAFAITKIFPVALNALGPAITFWIFAVCALLACLFVVFVVPETKGKALEEIQGML